MLSSHFPCVSIRFGQPAALLALGSLLSGSLLAACFSESTDAPEPVSRHQQGVLYCNTPHSELQLGVAHPFSAVGYLNNGCTAFMISSDYIVTAGHCVANGDNGRWQDDDLSSVDGLRFYPNYHPDRGTLLPPRADIEYAITGTRVGVLGTGRMVGSDWAIAKLTNWQNDSTINKSPIALADSSVPDGTAIMTAGYLRNLYENDDTTIVGGWDSTLCPAGQYAVNSEPKPIYDRNLKYLMGKWTWVNDYDNIDCNVRWAHGYIHQTNCWTNSADGLLTFKCSNSGGGSGAPILAQTGVHAGKAIGVISGTGHSNFHRPLNEGGPDPCDNSNTPQNEAPAVSRFIDAPRFASNIGIARKTNGGAGSGVFAIDKGLSKVAYRERIGTSYTDAFTYWKHLPDLPYGVADITRISVCNQPLSSKPEVFAVTNDSTRIYHIKATASQTWGYWSQFYPPTGVSVADIDTFHESNGRCAVVMTANGGNAYVRYHASDTSWNTNWDVIATGSYNRITAITDQYGIPWVNLLTTSGQMHRVSRLVYWGSPQTIAPPSGVSSWKDIDLATDEHGRAFLVALPTGAWDGKLRVTTAISPYVWNSWGVFQTYLWAPNLTTPPNATTVAAPQLDSITASRWSENPMSPVVFGTGEDGNVYFIEYRAVEDPDWLLDWKSFYHERIIYCDDTCGGANNGECNELNGSCDYGTDCTDCGPRPWASEL